MSSSNGSENCGGALMCELGLLFRAREGLEGARAQVHGGPLLSLAGYSSYVRDRSYISFCPISMLPYTFSVICEYKTSLETGRILSA